MEQTVLNSESQEEEIVPATITLSSQSVKPIEFVEEEINQISHAFDPSLAFLETKETTGPVCELCGKLSTSFCRNCFVTYNCCKEHQKSDWKRHKKVCSSVISLKITDGIRELVASKDIGQGEVFFKETPIIVFPFPKRQLQIICLECCSPIQNKEQVVPCTLCGWELCSNDCNKGKYHHENECKIFSKCELSLDSISSSLQQKYYIVGVIRALLLKGEDSHQWALMQNLYFERQGKKMFGHDEGDENLITFIRKNCKLDQFDETEIAAVLEILRFNSFNTSDYDTQSLLNASLVLPTAIQTGPSCVPNASLSIHGKDVNNLKIFMRATVPISRGSFISPSTYEKGIAATFLRRAIKKRVFFRPCVCDRCRDPTELGTYVSAIKCKICGDGYCLQKEPLVEDSCWECENENCRLVLKNRDVMLIIEQISEMLASAADGPFKEPSKESADFLLKCIAKLKKEILHPNHFMILNVEMDVCKRLTIVCEKNQLQGKNISSVGTMINDLASHVLSIADILNPGYSHLRGYILYYLQFGLVKDLLKSNPTTKSASNRQKQGVERGRKKRMEKLKHYQLEVESIFQDEPSDSEEKQLVCAMKAYMMVVDAFN